MKTLNWRKVSRFYIWIILLVIAVIIFILLKSPAAGQRQASQDPNGLSVSALDEASPTLSQSPAAAVPAAPDSASVSSTDDDGNLKPLPEVIPSPWPYPTPPFCPDYLEGSVYVWSERCSPCPPRLPINSTQNIVCLDLENTSAQL